MTWLIILVVVLLLVMSVISMLVLRSPFSMQFFGIQRCRQVSIEDAWQSWWQGQADSDSRQPGQMDPDLALNAGLRESVRENLRELEGRLLQATQPMMAVRQELMDSIDRRQLNCEILELSAEKRAYLRSQNPEILQTDAAAHTYISANELQISVLREYAGMRFGDAVEGDWFHVYLKASGLRQRGTRRFIERIVDGNHRSVDDVRFQTMAVIDGEIRRRLLQVPAGTRFPVFDKAQKPGRVD